MAGRDQPSARIVTALVVTALVVGGCQLSFQRSTTNILAVVGDSFQGATPLHECLR